MSRFTDAQRREVLAAGALDACYRYPALTGRAANPMIVPRTNA